MASLFEYEKEAIRIKAKRVDKGKDEYRKFSVDPNITSFEVLQSILCSSGLSSCLHLTSALPIEQ